MAVDPRKRQKKLERRKAKQKTERRELARRESSGMAARLHQAAATPILHCCVMDEIWSQGMGQLLISRQSPRGEVAFVVFLVDMYCLGVKNVLVGVSPRARYEAQVHERLTQRGRLTQLLPECARKLVEGAVAYAADLGFPPHEEYRAARMIFGDISAAACTQEFTYGKDGQPYFIGGPHDTPARCEFILRTLSRRLGPDQFHYIVPVGRDVLPADRLPAEPLSAESLPPPDPPE